MNRYEKLASSIICLAVADYRKVLRQLKNNPNDDKAVETLVGIEEFFYSEYFAILSNLDPKLLIQRLEKEVGA